MTYSKKDYINKIIDIFTNKTNNEKLEFASEAYGMSGRFDNGRKKDIDLFYLNIKIDDYKINVEDDLNLISVSLRINKSCISNFSKYFGGNLYVSFEKKDLDIYWYNDRYFVITDYTKFTLIFDCDYIDKNLLKKLNMELII